LSTDGARARGAFAEAWALFGLLMQRVGRIQARVMLAIVYLVIVPPLALVVQLGIDPLRVHRRYAGRSGWVDLPGRVPTAADLRRQF